MMAENLETDLNWPKDGLVGVPTAAEDPNGDQLGQAAEARAASSASSARNLPLTSVDDAVLSITRCIDELANTTAQLHSMLRDGASVSGGTAEWDAKTVADAATSLGRAEQSLDYLARLVTQVSVKLEAVNESLGDRLATAPIAPAASTADTDALGVDLPPASPHGFTLRFRHPELDPANVAVTWPPWIAPKRKRFFLFRPFIFVPLLLIAAAVAGGVAYKHHEDHKTLSGFPTTGQTIAGTTCVAGSTVTSIEVRTATDANGINTVGILGSVANGATTPLHSVNVHWKVTYADGYAATGVTAVKSGAVLNAKMATPWEALLSSREGSVPPVSAQVVQVTANPAQPICG